MERLLLYGLGFSLLLLGYSWWLGDRFVDDMLIQPELVDPPKQRSLRAPSFITTVNQTPYTVQPLYEYELHGLVVSYALHNAKYLSHKRWKDHFNVADYCVVWGSNATDLRLNRFQFRNGEFTCFVQTGDTESWRAFDMQGLSNNHLITDDPAIREALRDVRIGDQIRIRGWLSEYSTPGGISRGTSTVRTDTGNGACETIYVREFERLASMPNGWRPLFSLALWSSILCALGWVFGVAGGHFDYRR
ncbi:MAG: hypothetical protein ACPHCJ_10885 [Oceanococcaceae bacterium]